TDMLCSSAPTILCTAGPETPSFRAAPAKPPSSIVAIRYSRARSLLVGFIVHPNQMLMAYQQSFNCRDTANRADLLSASNLYYHGPRSAMDRLPTTMRHKIMIRYRHFLIAVLSFFFTL